MENPRMVRIGVVGKWTPGTDELLNGFLEAWEPESRPRVLGLTALEDIPVFSGYCDGWLLLHGDCIPWLDHLRADGKPMAGRSIEYLPHQIPIAPAGDEEAGRLAGEHLAALCSGELIYLGVPATFSRRRWEGFTEACRRAGLKARECCITKIDVEAFVKDLPGGSGIFAFNDQIAHRVLDVAVATNINVPRDLAVVGVDNGPLPPITDPIPLTTVMLSLKTQGREIGKLLRAQLEGSPCPVRVDVPPAGLIVRRSA